MTLLTCSDAWGKYADEWHDDRPINSTRDLESILFRRNGSEPEVLVFHPTWAVVRLYNAGDDADLRLVHWIADN